VSLPSAASWPRLASEQAHDLLHWLWTSWFNTRVDPVDRLVQGVLDPDFNAAPLGLRPGRVRSDEAMDGGELRLNQPILGFIVCGHLGQTPFIQDAEHCEHHLSL
jgi:hypothetical protein